VAQDKSLATGSTVKTRFLWDGTELEDDPRMKTRILITGVGGPAALGCMRALRRRRVEFFAGDMDPNAAGLYTVPEHRRTLLLPAKHPRYVEHILQYCISNQIDVLWPTVDDELLPLALNRGAFTEAGIKLIIPDISTLRMCLDKWRLYEVCRRLVPCPRTQLGSALKQPPLLTGTCILKPRRGSGSRGIQRIANARNFQPPTHPQRFILQKELPGDEYSVDVFISNDRTTRVAVPRLRSKVDSGIAVTSETVHDSKIQAMALKVAHLVKLRGVANIQFKCDSNGRPHLLEVNPRVAGTMILSVKAGVNLPALALDNVLGIRLPKRLSFRELAVVRMHREHYVPREELADMRKQVLRDWDSEEEVTCAPHSAA